MNFGDMTAMDVVKMHAKIQKDRKKMLKNCDPTYLHGRKYETSYNSPLMDAKPKTIPNIAISPVNHLIQGFNFILTLNNFTYGFKEISGFRLENPVDYIAEGGVNDHQLIVGKPSDETPTLECRRGLMIRSNPIFSNAARMAAAMVPNNLGRKAALMAVNTMDPQATLEQGPAVGTIEVYDINKRLCAMYTFLSLGMRSWECDGLSADSSGILIESITIAHTGLTRVPLGAPNTYFGYIPAETEEQAGKDYKEKNWLTFDLDRLKEFKAQEEYLKAQEEAFEKQKEEIAKAKKEKEEAIKKLKEEYAKLQESMEAADKAAKEREEKNKKDYEENAEKVEKAKEQAAKESAEKEAKAKEDAKTAKEKAEAARKEQVEKRQKEIEEQTAATEQEDLKRSKSDQKAVEEAKNQQEEAQEKADEAEAKKQENAVDDDTAKENAEKARAEAKDKAAQNEAKKQGDSK